MQKCILLQRAVSASSTTKHIPDDVKTVGGKIEDANHSKVLSPSAKNTDETSSATSQSNANTILLDGGVTNSAPLAKFENLESALTTTLGTHARCTTVPHIVNPVVPYSRVSNVASQQINLAQVSSLGTMQHLVPVTLETCEATQTSTTELAHQGAVFHVGTPPAHYSDSASQTEVVSTRDPLDHMFSPTTSYGSDYDLQVFPFFCIS